MAFGTPEDQIAQDYGWIGGISVIMLSYAILLLIYSMLKIRWNNYRFKNIHLYLMITVVVLFTAW